MVPGRGLSWALLAALLVMLAAPAQAQWKWRDASGRITVSDLPPPRETPEKDILQRPDGTVRRAAPAAAPASAPAAVPAPPMVDRELEARRRAAEQEQAAQQKADEERVAQQRAENCRRARAHLSALESGQRIARMNDKGEREILDDRARADEMRQARQVISTDCR